MAKRKTPATSSTGPVRCAVYTRKSSEEGLDQAFNSLHAQREACEAYVVSQKHEGWTLIPTFYDDGGHSGGTMERPALKTLLADVAAGLIDTVVVYKVDRLSRSLTDFARMVDLFDAVNCAFVSVTQAFSTTTSMGRLTLNMLLSFAQFEREVTGERIRDKIAASKAKGMWMGGFVPLGYEPDGRSLTVNAAEAKTVVTLFELYRRTRSVDEVVIRAKAMGLSSKRRTRRDGSKTGGGALGRAAVYRILANRLYLGEITHKGQVHAGLHEAIVSPGLFQAVTDLLDQQRRKRAGQGASPALLTGRLFSDTGERLTPTHTQKGEKRYRYYAGGSLRLPMADVDDLVVEAFATTLSEPGKLAGLLPDAQLITGGLLKQAARLAQQLSRRSTRAEVVEQLVTQATVEAEQVTMSIDLTPLGLDGMTATLVIPATIGRDRTRLALVVPGPTQASPDAGLVALVAQARDWFQRLAAGEQRSVAALARTDGLTEAYVRQLLPAALMAPDLVTRIVEGRQPRAITVARFKELLPLPADWDEQRAVFAGL